MAAFYHMERDVIMTKPKKNSPKLVQIVAGKPAESSQGNRHSFSSSRIGDQPLNVQHNMRRGLHFLSDPLLTRWHKNLINARHEMIELSTKISSCITFGLLTLGFKEAQRTYGMGATHITLRKVG